jgi:hypothetical protein
VAPSQPSRPSTASSPSPSANREKHLPTLSLCRAPATLAR